MEIVGYLLAAIVGISLGLIGSGGEIQLTDSLREMCKNNPFFYKKNTQNRFDCGNVLGYLEANLAFALNDDNIKQEVKNIIKKYQE